MAAALMYPLDLVRALKMANAGAELSTPQLPSNFRRLMASKDFLPKDRLLNLLDPHE
jgi:hypothetical protein